MHEAAMHQDNCFITLTYDEEHLPWDGSLNKDHWQKFMKRLRFKYRPKNIRYFHCGEYGSRMDRPHYHALLFGHDFNDKTLWASKDGVKTYISDELESLWPFGYSTVGNVTYQSAAYCARYTLKKRTGKDAKDHYWRMVATDLEVELQPEYATMSLKPAIGKTWFDEFKDDLYPSDFVTHNGKKHRIPKYYDKLLGELDQEQLRTLKARRLEKARKHHANNTKKRLAVREKCAQARLDHYSRNYEA